MKSYVLARFIKENLNQQFDIPTAIQLAEKEFSTLNYEIEIVLPL
jgi:hypothetical protein